MKLLQILYPGLGGHSSVAKSIISGDKDKVFNHALLGYGIEKPNQDLTSSKDWEFEYVIKCQGFDLKSFFNVYHKLKKSKPEAIIVHSTSQVLTVFVYNLFHKVRWSAVEHQSNHAKSKMDWVYTIIILLFAPKIVYLSENYAKEIEQKFPFLYKKKKISIIQNGIDTDLFSPKLENKKDKPFVISMVSRMNSLRDHNTLIDSFNQLLKTYPKLILKIAGNGDTFKSITNKIEQLKLDENVELLGMINETEIVSLLKETDIYVHSSLAETQSTSIMQAMAVELPIVATNIPGISNMIQNSETGYLFKVGNQNDLLEKILFLINKPNDKARIANNARLFAVDNYSNKQMFLNYKKVLFK